MWLKVFMPCEPCDASRETRVSTDMMVHMAGVTKRFGTFAALRGIDLEVRRGNCLGLLGPNGAGKTTLLRILATLTRPSSGTVRIAGHDAMRYASRVRPLLGVLSHRTFLYGHLTAWENLHFYGRMFGITQLPKRIEEVLHLIGLEVQSRQLVRTYSRGMQQRLAIARTILHAPVLLLLDEPYTGLDQQAIARLQAMLLQLRSQGCTIIMSTHDLHRTLTLCDDIAIQRRGKIVCISQASELDAQGLEKIYGAHVG